MRVVAGRAVASWRCPLQSRQQSTWVIKCEGCGEQTTINLPNTGHHHSLQRTGGRVRGVCLYWCVNGRAGECGIEVCVCLLLPFDEWCGLCACLLAKLWVQSACLQRGLSLVGKRGFCVCVQMTVCSGNQSMWGWSFHLSRLNSSCVLWDLYTHVFGFVLICRQIRPRIPLCECVRCDLSAHYSHMAVEYDCAWHARARDRLFDMPLCRLVMPCWTNPSARGQAGTREGSLEANKRKRALNLGFAKARRPKISWTTALKMLLSETREWWRIRVCGE